MIPGGCGYGECPDAQVGGVQEMVVDPLEAGAAVEGIAEQGVADRGQVNADLMAACEVRSDLDQRSMQSRAAR